jgi:hypothetical protein
MDRKSSTLIDGDNIDHSKVPNAHDEYAPAQRHIIDARLKKALDEVKRGQPPAPPTPPMK